MTLLRAATDRITPRTFLLTLTGTAVLLILGWCWLYMPESHVWQVVSTFLLGAAIIAALLALYAAVLRSLTRTDAKPHWRSALLLAVWLFFGWALQHIANKLGTHIEERAGYWNSQLSPHHRVLLPYERLVHLQTLALDALLWIVIPAVLLPFMVATVARLSHAWRTAGAVLVQPQHWLAVAAAYILGTLVGDHLLAWHPSYSVRGELVSVVLRTLLVYVLAVVLLLVVLALVAELLARERDGRNSVT